MWSLQAGQSLRFCQAGHEIVNVRQARRQELHPTAGIVPDRIQEGDHAGRLGLLQEQGGWLTIQAGQDERSAQMQDRRRSDRGQIDVFQPQACVGTDIVHKTALAVQIHHDHRGRGADLWIA